MLRRIMIEIGDSLVATEGVDTPEVRMVAKAIQRYVDIEKYAIVYEGFKERDDSPFPESGELQEVAIPNKANVVNYEAYISSLITVLKEYPHISKEAYLTVQPALDKLWQRHIYRIDNRHTNEEVVRERRRKELEEKKAVEELDGVDQTTALFGQDIVDLDAGMTPIMICAIINDSDPNNDVYNYKKKVGRQYLLGYTMRTNTNDLYAKISAMLKKNGMFISLDWQHNATECVSSTAGRIKAYPTRLGVRDVEYKLMVSIGTYTPSKVTGKYYMHDILGTYVSKKSTGISPPAYKGQADNRLRITLKYTQSISRVNGLPVYGMTMIFNRRPVGKLEYEVKALMKKAGFYFMYKFKTKIYYVKQSPEAHNYVRGIIKLVERNENHLYMEIVNPQLRVDFNEVNNNDTNDD